MTSGIDLGSDNGAVTAGLVHDLGNLIQIAASAINLIADHPDAQADGLKPIVSGARSSLESAAILVRGTMEIALRKANCLDGIDLPGVMNEIEEIVRSTWQCGVRLDIAIGSNLPSVKCDPLALKSALLNLLLNARDATPDGGRISIKVVTGPVENGLATVEIHVSDSGIGMTAETLSHAFEPFFTTKPGGLGGVGLPTVRRFAEDMGGCIRAESTYGAGTTMILQLPVFTPRKTPVASQNEGSTLIGGPS